MKVIKYIKQHPIISAIIGSATLTVITTPMIFASQNYQPALLLFAIWYITMAIAGILFVISLIMIGFKIKHQDIWKKLLLSCLWILVVGLGCCGGVFSLLSLGYFGF